MQRYHSRILFGLLSCLVWGCTAGPAQRITDANGSPNYHHPGNWAALPEKKDLADRVPDGSLQDRQDSAAADVFFIHPTTYFGFPAWNASLTDRSVNRKTDRGTVRHQASAFNGSCRVYAPRYRQAALRAFFSGTEKKEKALNFAYRDVKKAFSHYLRNYHDGRPIVIASHSQGSRHAVKLLEEFFDTSALKQHLVAAYLIGMPVACDTFQTIPTCNSASQTGCFVSWNTFGWGEEPPLRLDYESACCINPLNWRQDDSYAERSANLGGVPTRFHRTDPEVADARCQNGILWAHPPAKNGYPALGKNYHLIDYNLYYVNIRKNVKTRVEQFLKIR